MLKTVSILGFPKSGTTILGRLLGEIDGLFDLGEVERLWWRLTREDEGRCGCGEVLSQCKFWSRVLSRTFPEAWERKLRENGSRGWKAEISSETRAVSRPELMRRLYDNVSQVSGASILLIDATPDLRSATKEMLLNPARDVEAYFIHLVRDARGCVFNRQSKRLSRTDRRHLKLISASADSLRWVRSNWKAASVLKQVPHDRRLSVRYEDFADRPEEIISQILRMLGAGDAGHPLSESRTAVLGVNHTAGGNKNRFTTGEVPIEKDMAWAHDLESSDKWLITSLTLPLLVKYGYPARVSLRP